MIVTRTPLRVSFFGGGTDLPDWYEQEPGAVLSMAIQQYVYVITKNRWEPNIYAHYSQNEVVERVDELKHDLIREAMRYCGVECGKEIVTLADIPSRGSGLGSSSSLTVGLVKALKPKLTILQLAEAACDVEIGRAGHRIGKQDQYIAAFGGIKHMTFGPDGVHVDWPVVPGKTQRLLESHLMLYYTGQQREADAVLDTVREGITGVEKRSLMRRLVGMASEGRSLLESADMRGFGNLLHAAWMIKRHTGAAVSNDEIDSIYETARANGASGGKICGAGGGGFILLFCEPEKQPRLRYALQMLRELPVAMDAQGCRVLVDTSKFFESQHLSCRQSICQCEAVAAWK